jgi:hypothetical protein
MRLLKGFIKVVLTVAAVAVLEAVGGEASP